MIKKFQKDQKNIKFYFFFCRSQQILLLAV